MSLPNLFNPNTAEPPLTLPICEINLIALWIKESKSTRHLNFRLSEPLKIGLRVSTFGLGH